MEENSIFGWKYRCSGAVVPKTVPQFCSSVLNVPTFSRRPTSRQRLTNVCSKTNYLCRFVDAIFAASVSTKALSLSDALDRALRNLTNSRFPRPREAQSPRALLAPSLSGKRSVWSILYPKGKFVAGCSKFGGLPKALSQSLLNSASGVLCSGR